MLHFVVFSIYPAPLALWLRHASLGLAHGACILASKRAYESVGGHQAVASAIFEDTRLARLWLERGERSLCLDGRLVVRVRMYGSLREIWLGFEKNFRAGFRSSVTFWAFLAGHAVFFLAPFALSATAAAAVIAIRLVLAVRFRHPLWSALLHPAAECFLLALGLSSWWKLCNGRGVAWKGRRYRQV
jgi:chlorobactene glucosyltransferase